MKKIMMVAALLLLTGSAHAATFDVSIDPGAPISASTGQIFLNAPLMKATGARYVRVNFILGPWSSPTDTTRRGPSNLTWQETYSEIINNLRAEGMEIYALIGAEAVKNGGSTNSEQYVAKYAQNFETIVGMFKDRIRVYESFNEPNNWVAPQTPAVEPYWFARMLEEIYTRVKLNHKADPSWQVTLVSGPLFSHDMDTVAPYFDQVYSAGKNQLSWTNIKNLHGTYPLDGIGYHIYVKGGPNPPEQVRNGINTNLNAIWGIITKHEGAGTNKKLWISEFSWNTASVSEDEQARNLTLAFNLFKDDPRVTWANWFQISDFGPTEKWGLFRGGPFVDSNKKPSWYAFREFALSQLPTGAVSGTVKDLQGNAVSGAKVASTDGQYETTTDSNGAYSITGMMPGTLTLEASAFGYRSQQRAVVVQADETKQINFSLLTALPSDTPQDAKARPETYFTRINGLVVSAVFGGDRVYVQQEGRSSGIGVLTEQQVSVGDRVDVTGYVVNQDGERLLMLGDVLKTGQGDAPRPLFVPLHDLGGGPSGNQPAVANVNGGDLSVYAEGLNNVGLLVRVSGRVADVDMANGYYYITDGSGIDDGSGNAGARVLAAASYPQEGQFVTVTGISSVTLLDGVPVRLLRPRSTSDLVIL